MLELQRAGLRRLKKRFIFLAKPWYRIRSGYRQVRISAPVTKILGPQYVRSRERIEIDITYMCNLRCLNCNRSISQAPEKLHMPLEMIRRFVGESMSRNKRWKTIRVLGGEPTLHPQFLDILQELLRYRRWAQDCSVEVVSNGNGKAVKAMLKKIPAGIRIENSAKEGNVQPGFGAFNLAPVDDPAFRFADYRNGCAVMSECGMGLTPFGYYPCAVAGGIDRIAGTRHGYASPPAEDDDMTPVANALCRLCGHFREGHFIPEGVRPVLTEEKRSESWVRLYDHWAGNKRAARKSRTQAGAAHLGPGRGGEQ